ncbi:MAG: spermidine synthase, partial [Aminobacterium sp.]|nr:spermidine synthase [Aminobacterium sp.]
MERRAKRFNELWVTEEQTPNMKLSLRINQVLVNKKSEYQDITLVETMEYGRMLILDGAIQIAER